MSASCKLRLAMTMMALVVERVQETSGWEPGGGNKCIVVVIRWETGCGKAYLSMDVATESKVADTEGSTATGAPLQKIRNILSVFLCVPPHNKTGNGKARRSVG